MKSLTMLSFNVMVGFGSGGQQLSPIVQDTEPIKRVAGDDPDYTTNFARRTMQKLGKIVGK